MCVFVCVCVCVCVCVPVQLERVLYFLVVGLLYQLALEVTHTHSSGDDGVQQWLEELRNDGLGNERME